MSVQVTISCLLLILGATSFAGPVAAVENPLTEEEIIERILELRREIEDLLEALPPELRQEVERRWEVRRSPDRGPTDEIAEPKVEPPALPPPADTEAGDLARSEEPTAAVLCSHFKILDDNADDRVSGGDRYWRYLRLWNDDGDSRLTDSEIESLLQYGVKSLEVGLRSYMRADGSTGELDLADVLYLILESGKDATEGRRVLLLDASRLARGEDRLVDSDGGLLTGWIPIGRGLFLQSAEGMRAPLVCP